jgi:hypothetical protein
MTHLTDAGEFKSDKYDWCPDGFFPMKFTDPDAREAIALYASRIGAMDPELKADLRQAVRNARAEDDDRQPEATELGEEEEEQGEAEDLT